MWMQQHTSRTFFKYKCDYCIASEKDSMVWEGKNGIGPNGLGVNHCFTTSLVSLRKSVILSDNQSSLKQENSAYLNTMYETWMKYWYECIWYWICSLTMLVSTLIRNKQYRMINKFTQGEHLLMYI